MITDVRDDLARACDLFRRLRDEEDAHGLSVERDRHRSDLGNLEVGGQAEASHRHEGGMVR
jgi:hypothetical protein